MFHNVAAGLCASCVHARTVESSKGATFIRCELSFSSPRFPRYPTLPVRRCEGYEGEGCDGKKGEPGTATGARRGDLPKTAE